jgi:hypothetical protein
MRMNLPTTALTLTLAAFGLGLLPSAAGAIPATAPTLTAATDSTIHVAYVKKKKVVKKTIRPRGYAYGYYGFRAYQPRYSSNCRSITRYVYRNKRKVKVVSRSC